MKKFLTFVGISSLVLGTNSYAIERLTPIKEPSEASVKSKESSPKAWLGVAGKPVDGALAAQLGIDHGVTIELIAEDGSAGKAGIKRFDVITRIGDKPINDMKDLRSVMKASAVNQTLEVEVFSEGKLQNHKVVLDAHPGDFAKNKSRRSRVRSLGKRPTPKAKKQPQAFQLPPEVGHERMEKIMEAQLRQMEQHFAQMNIDSADLLSMQKQAQQMKFGNLGASIQSSSRSSVTVMDEAGSIQVKSSSKSGKHVEVKDKSGKIVYSGPYQTDADKEKVPDDVRARIDALGLESGDGNFSFSFGR